MEGFVPLPAKELAYNRCPAVAPVGVIDQAAQARIKIDMQLVAQNLAKLRASDLPDKLRDVFTRQTFAKIDDPDARLYDGFLPDNDRAKLGAVRNAKPDELADFRPDFTDERLAELLTRYKARNYPHTLSGDERDSWEAYRTDRLQHELPDYMQKLAQLSQQAQTTDSHFLLSELQLWAESIASVE
jgi:exodeoxyribonuclease I